MKTVRVSITASTKQPLAGSPPATFARLSTTALGIGSGISVILMALPSLRSESVFGKDLVQEYHLAQALLSGSDPYASGYLTAHPPTAGLLFLPMATLDYPSAAAAWFWLETACLILSVYLLARATGIHPSPVTTLAVAGILLPWQPVIADLSFGQLGLVQLPFVAGAWWAIRSRRLGVAGVLVGISLLIKPFLWPLALLFLLFREWSALRTLAVTLLAGYAITIWRIGYEAHVTYFTQTLPATTAIYKDSLFGVSLWSLGWRLFDGTSVATLHQSTVEPLVRWPSGARAVSLAIPSIALLGGYRAVRKARQLDQAFGLAICLSILVSPIAWTHYLTLALIPAAQVVNWLQVRGFPRGPTVASILVGALMLLPQMLAVTAVSALVPANPGAGSGSVPLPVSLSYMEPTLALIGLAFLVAALGAREASPTSSSAPR